MSVALVFGRLKLPPRLRDPLDNLTHLTLEERVSNDPCVCESCIKALPERRALKIRQRAMLQYALRGCERL